MPIRRLSLLPLLALLVASPLRADEDSAPLVVATPGAAHPQARINHVDAAAGVVTFAWLDSDGAPVDSGNSIAHFTPADTDADGEPDSPHIATLATALTGSINSHAFSP